MTQIFPVPLEIKSTSLSKGSSEFTSHTSPLSQLIQIEKGSAFISLSLPFKKLLLLILVDVVT